MRNNGKWTEGRYRSFITSVLRAGSRKWPPKYEVLQEAKTEKKTNVQTGRLAQHFKCAECKKHFPASKIQVDHIQPVVPPDVGFTTWDEFIERLYCEKENLQCLCDGCHTLKSRREKQLRIDVQNAHKNSTFQECQKTNLEEEASVLGASNVEKTTPVHGKRNIQKKRKSLGSEN